MIARLLRFTSSSPAVVRDSREVVYRGGNDGSDSQRSSRPVRADAGLVDSARRRRHAVRIEEIDDR